MTFTVDADDVGRAEGPAAGSIGGGGNKSVAEMLRARLKVCVCVRVCVCACVCVCVCLCV